MCCRCGWPATTVDKVEGGSLGYLSRAHAVRQSGLHRPGFGCRCRVPCGATLGPWLRPLVAMATPKARLTTGRRQLVGRLRSWLCVYFGLSLLRRPKAHFDSPPRVGSRMRAPGLLYARARRRSLRQWIPAFFLFVGHCVSDTDEHPQQQRLIGQVVADRYGSWSCSVRVAWARSTWPST